MVGMTYQVGGEVRVFDNRDSQGRHPEGGWRGSVTKVARRYATATYRVPAATTGEYERTIEFDMETGRERGSTSSWSLIVKTPEGVERDLRHVRAMATLKQAGLEVRLSHRAPGLELAEALAAVVETFGQEG